MRRNCPRYSYQLKSFKALTRVDKTTGGGQDSSSSTLSGLTDVIIVGGLCLLAFTPHTEADAPHVTQVLCSAPCHGPAGQ